MNTVHVRRELPPSCGRHIASWKSRDPQAMICCSKVVKAATDQLRRKIIAAADGGKTAVADRNQTPLEIVRGHRFDAARYRLMFRAAALTLRARLRSANIRQVKEWILNKHI